MEVGGAYGRSGAGLSILQNVAVKLAEARRGRQESDRLEKERSRLREAIQVRERQLELAMVTYSTFTRVKNAEIQQIYDELRGDLARYYDVLHPEEGFGAVSIAMDLRKRGSSELRMKFFGREDEDPRAFASEGHLDSLGLCIFLAFVRRFNGSWPLLILDDVVTSVDAAHKRRVASLLFEEFGDRQLLVTTQDSRWFNDLRQAQSAAGLAKDVTNLVIESWTLDRGPTLRPAA